MIENLCARCERPQPDTAVVCDRCAQNLAADLDRAAGHADDAPAVVARQVRYGPGGAGGGNERPLPYDPVASERLWVVENTITTWVRHAEEERGMAFEVPSSHVEGRTPLDPCSPLGSACRWLSGHVEWLRHRPEAAEAFDELDDACKQLRQLVDRPADRVLVGMCECGRVLYALAHREAVVCPDCVRRWMVADSREVLRQALDDHLVTAAEAARLASYLGTDRTREQLRKLITKWADRGLIEVHGELNEERAYRFGDVAVRLAQTPRRERRMAA